MRNAALAKYSVMLATVNQLDAVVAIARANVDTLGFLPRGGFISAIEKKEILVAIDRVSSDVVAFLQFHARRDRKVTIHKYAVVESLRGVGIGTSLLSCLVDMGKRNHWHIIQLKVVEGTPACSFYGARGFVIVGREKAAKRHILVMQKKIWNG